MEVDKPRQVGGLPGNREFTVDTGKENAAKVKKRSKSKKASSSRGRSRKRNSAKGKEPYNHIASSLLPLTAFATAVPKATETIIRSRSPSPVVKAIVFATKIGQAIAAGKNLTKSLSEQELSSKKQNISELKASEFTSRSNPGVSSNLEPLQHGDYEDVSYESIDDIHNASSIPKRSQIIGDDTSPMARRPPLPLPNEDIVDGTKDTVEDLYAKVSKKPTHFSSKSKLQAKNVSHDDSDEITSVSEMDEESSKHVKEHKIKSKHELQVEDTSDGPSEGEIYRQPFDSILTHKSQGLHFQTIEEFEEGNTSQKSSMNKSPVTDLPNDSSSYLNDEAAGQKRFPLIHSEFDAQNQPSRPQTPRDLGREAALRQLEKLGFDGMSKEFNITEKHNADYFKGERSFASHSFESQLEAVEANLDKNSSLESEKIDRSINDKSVISILSRPSTAKIYLKGDKASHLDKSMDESKLITEEPLMHSSEILPQYSSGEMLLDELRNENSYETENRKQFNSKNNNSQHASESAPKLDAAKDLDGSIQAPFHHLGMDTMKNEIANMMQLTDDELRRQGNTQKAVIDNQLKIQEQMRKMHSSITHISDHDRSTGFSQIDDTSSSQLQKYIDAQNGMKQNQDKILNTIMSLENQLKDVVSNFSSDQKQQKNQEEELIYLRKLIVEEQRKYIEQQKILEEQQKRILSIHQGSSPKPTQSSNLKLSHVINAPHQFAKTKSPRSVHVNQPDHFTILENRLKSVEAERQALIDLNSSMQDENDALKKMALNQIDAGPSVVVHQRHNKELLESNQNLKNLVHRLNVELSRFQMKYQPPHKEEFDGLALPEEGPIPQWIVNTNYLSPLLLAYDDRLKEKNDVIRAYELQLTSFKGRMLEVVRENQKLHMMFSTGTDDVDSVHINDWNILQEQAKLLVEENSILMQEIELKDKRIEELQKVYQSEVQQFSRRLNTVEKENRHMQSCLINSKIENESLKKKLDDAIDESKRKITEEEFQNKLSESKRLSSLALQNLQNQNENSAYELQSVCKSKQELAIKLTDATARNSELQLEADLLTKKLKKAEKQLLMMQEKLNAARERETIATQTLTDVLSVAEKNAKQRDELSHLLKTQRTKNASSQRQKKEDGVKLELLVNDLKKYKSISQQKTLDAIQRLTEKEDEMLQMRDRYEQEIGNLKGLLKEKQDILDHTQLDKRQFEDEIDKMWQTVAAETEQLKKSINK